MDMLRIGAREPVMLRPGAGDKLSHLKPGDVVRAQVVRVTGDGELSLRMGGSIIQAKMALSLPPGATLLFRVLGREGGESGGALRLQFIQLENSENLAQPAPPPSPGPIAAPSLDTLRTLARQYAATVPLKGRTGAELVTIVRDLLKALPTAQTPVPRELRLELMHLLQTGLRESEQSIQNRARLLFDDPKVLALIEQSDLYPLWESPHAEGEKWTWRAGLPLFAEAENLPHVPLRSVLTDTGVALEARLKTLAQALFNETAQEASGELPTSLQISEWAQAGSLSTDLKARLLQLREKILEQEPSPSDPHSPASGDLTTGSGKDKETLQRVLSALDGLLGDIETFQLLSKLTESFYTFIPFLWRGLKEGDIAFKRGRGPGGEPAHYCVLNLDLERLGSVSIVALKQGDDFFLSFKTDHRELRSVLDENVDTLREMFRQEGLNLREVNFHHRDDPGLAPFINLESFESGLDLKI